jgi:signal transduction histidine kinase
MFLLKRAAERRCRRAEADARAHERAARDLHDALLQGTQGLILNLQVIASDLPVGHALRLRIEGVLDHADEVLAQSRDSAQRLRGDIPG